MSKANAMTDEQWVREHIDRYAYQTDIGIFGPNCGRFLGSSWSVSRAVEEDARRRLEAEQVTAAAQLGKCLMHQGVHPQEKLCSAWIAVAAEQGQHQPTPTTPPDAMASAATPHNVDEFGYEWCPPGSADRQRRVGAWCVEAFGESHAMSIPQRGIRLLEEAAEAAQAAGCDIQKAHQLLDYVWSRPVGRLGQELGGIGVTLLALAHAANLNADECEAREIQRVLNKPLEHFRKRNAEKNAAGFNVEQQPEQTELRALRDRVQELEAALTKINEVSSQSVTWNIARAALAKEPK